MKYNIKLRKKNLGMVLLINYSTNSKDSLENKKQPKRSIKRQTEQAKKVLNPKCIHLTSEGIKIAREK